MKIYTLLLICCLAFFSCKKSNDLLNNNCWKCSYSTEASKVTQEICDDVGVSDTEKIEMEERMQKEADALNVELNCFGN